MVLFFLIVLIPFEIAAYQITSGFEGYRTIKTEHFRVHYPRSKRREAHRIAKMTEEVHSRLIQHYSRLNGKTDVVLVYDNDIVNAYASVVGRDHVVLFLNNPRLGPDGGSGWSYYDDWARELFIHEYTHILTIRTREKLIPKLFYLITGLPANVLAPSGMTEGIAVYEESLEGHGRNNDPITRMIFRKAIETNTWPGPAELMNGSHRWPRGSIYYIYGGSLHEYVANNYKDQLLRDYWNTNFPPIFLDSRLRRSGAKPYTALYQEHRREMEQVLNREILSIFEKGVTPEERLTNSGGYKSDLIFEKDSAVYFQSRANQISGLFRTNLKDGKSIRFRRATAVKGITSQGGVRLFAEDYYAYPDFGMRFELYNPDRTFFQRMLPGKSVSHPSLSRDGKVLYYVEKDFHWKTLIRASVEEELIQNSEVFRVPRSGILQGVAASPGGSAVVFLARKDRNGRPSLIECGEKKCKRLLNNRYATIHPVFLNEEQIAFSSDRSGAFNVYRLDRSTGEVRQLTRTAGGHFHPAMPNRDQRYLYYLTYTQNGYDLARTPVLDLLHQPVGDFQVEGETELNRNLFEANQSGHSGQGHTPGTPFLDEPYGGWTDLDFAYSGLLNGGYLPGYSFVHIGFIANDPLNRHSLSALAGYASTGPEGYLQYDYNRYKISFTTSYYTNRLYGEKVKRCHFRRKSYYEQIFCGTILPFQEQSDGYLRYRSIGRYVSMQVLAGYKHTRILEADRYSGIEYQYRDVILSGPSMVMILGKTHSYPESISQEDGWNLEFGVDYYLNQHSMAKLQDPDRSEIEYSVIKGGLSLYLPSIMDHHVHYLNGYGYTSYGKDRDAQKVSMALFVRGQSLSYAKKGRSSASFTYEYRFPLFWLSDAIIQRFPEWTVRQVDMAFFLDTGAAFTGRPLKKDFLSGYGFRLNAGMDLYYVSLPVQMGFTVARGTGPSGETQLRIHATIGFFGPIAGNSQDRRTRPSAEALARPVYPGLTQSSGFIGQDVPGSILH